MSKQLALAEILENTPLGGNIYKLRVRSKELAPLCIPGQFVQIGVNDGAHVLRRPLSIASSNGEEMLFIYQVRGEGTAFLARCQRGTVSLLGPLGNGFSPALGHSLLIGGGVGSAPLYFLAQKLEKATGVFGARDKEAIVWAQDLFGGLCHVTAHYLTDDGSFGQKGLSVDILPDLLQQDEYEAIYTCGPEPMMRAVFAVAKSFGVKCFVSLERRMGCGLGACLSCTIKTLKGRKKVCSDGPVFEAREVFFDGYEG